ncbi:MAG: hypothetical protein WKF71_02270 [Pyrinomonadaceae bacterium]
MLEEVYLIKNKQEILAAQGKPDEALKEIDRGLDLAEQYLPARTVKHRCASGGFADIPPTR